MVFPPVSFIENDKGALAAYFCYIAKSIQLGKYPKGNYVVLPDLIRKNPLSVHFPRFPYSHRFWKLIVRQERYSVPGPFPTQAMREVLSFLTEYQAPDTDRQKELWYQKKRQFAQTVSDVMDTSSLLGNIGSIRVLITEFGTLGSFSVVPQAAGKWTLVCTWRTDADVTDFFRTILQAFILTRQGSGPQVDVGGLGWFEREAILRFFLTQTKLKQYASGRRLAKPTEHLIRESGLYLASLGFPVQWRIDPSFTNRLTNQERVLWTYLLAKTNHIVSFDEAANVVWKADTDEKFSLYALAKLVENIRRKLRNFGIHHDVLVTIRRQGYMVVA